MKEFLKYNPKLTQYARDMRNNPTYSEKLMWQILKHDALGYDFHRQKPLGEFIYDFFCKELKLVIEVDGITHEEQEVKENDKRKDDYAREIGFNIMRFTDEMVIQNGNQVEKIIKEYIKNYEEQFH